MELLPPAGLVGREPALEVVWSFAAQATVSGGGLVIAGEPGVGKTTLLEAVATEAEAAGMRVLRAAGVEDEAGVSYAGLNPALLPLTGSIPLPDSAYRDALRVVLGLDVALTPDRFTLCNAFLELLRRNRPTYLSCSWWMICSGSIAPVRRCSASLPVGQSAAASAS